MNEQWSLIKEVEDRYEVSNFGRIRHVRKNRIRVITTHSSGYCIITLKINGKSVTFYVHRLVGKYHVLNPDNKPHINHKDGDKTNNKADNLEWCTISENAIHAFALGLRKATEKQKEATREFNRRTKSRNKYY